eukprot:UN31920
MLYFQVNETDVMSVYELLGMHNHTWNPNSGGISMAETDLIKNYFLSQFTDEKIQIKVFRVLWCPIEKNIVNANDVTTSFDKLFKDFIDHLAKSENKEENIKTDDDDDVQAKKFDLFDELETTVDTYVNKNCSLAPKLLNKKNDNDHKNIKNNPKKKRKIKIKTTKS